MLLVEKKAKLKWNPANKKKYVDLGYEFTAWKDEFLVEINDITPTTRAMVSVQCDYCEDIREITFKDYRHMQDRTSTGKDSCSNDDCMQKKREENNLIVYGFTSFNESHVVKKKRVSTIKKKYGEQYTSVTQIPEFKAKGKETSLAKYGTEFPASSEIVRDKITKTNIEKYGSENYMGTKEFYEKSKVTNLTNYGVEYASQSEDIKEKIKDTNIDRYGFPNPMQNEEVRLKGIKTNRERYGVEYYTQTDEYKEKFSGEGNQNWNPKITDEDRENRFERPEQQATWRRWVFKRDNYICQCCSKKGVKLNAHHKDGYHWCTERRTDVSNGVTLCEECHFDFHMIYGYKNNTEEQFIEFKKLYHK